MHCAVCQTPNRPERRFCHACAAPLEAAACAGCGFVNHPGERYCGGCAVDLGEEASAARVPVPLAAAERRQMTVMFCDMVGSTALSTELDPEDLRDLVNRFQRTCAEAIARFDGFVARYMGDGMLVYFGYPVAHEDSAERAVRAGLAIVEAVAAMGADPVQAEVRVGIATGRVVVGDLIGEGVSEERAVVGETPNLAARLQGLAAPGEVVLSARTRRLVGPSLGVEDLGRHALKGFPDPVQAWRAIGWERKRRDADGPLVGRSFELGLLRARWRAATAGTGGIVSLVGDAASGKSRLADAFGDEVRDAGARVVRLGCSRHQEHTALHPLLDHLAAASGIELSDGAEVRRAKVEARLDADQCALVDLLAPDPSDETSPDERRRRLLAAAERYLLASTPALVVVEDVHRADPSTLELLERVRAAGSAVLLLATHRTDFQAPWRSASGHTSLTLGRLGPEAAAELVRAVSPGVSDAVLRAVVDRGDGLPGYLVELARSAESGGGGVPETLHDSLAARLDRLGAARPVAQAAAVLGQDFDRGMLVAVTGLGSAELGAHLDALVAADVVAPPGAEGGRWSFRQGLLADVAYDSLLKRDLRRLHDRAATVVIEEHPSAADAAPDRVARHLDGAGRHREAASWWTRAADRARGQGAFVESGARYLEAVASMRLAADPDAADDLRELAGTEVEAAMRLRLVGRWEEAFALLEQAEARIVDRDMPDVLSYVYHCRGNIYFNLGDSSACVAAHRRALALAEQSESVFAQVRALGGLADGRGLEGYRDEAGELGRRCVELAMEHGFDEIAAANAPQAAFAFFWAARTAEAWEMARVGIELSRRTGALRALLYSYNAAVLVAADRGEHDLATRLMADRDAAIGTDPLHGFLAFADYRAYRARGAWDEGHRLVEESVASRRMRWLGADVVNFSCLVARCDDADLPGLLEDIFAKLRETTTNFLQWTAVSLIEGLIHRGAWDELDRVLAFYEAEGRPDLARRIAIWIDTGRVARAWHDAPSDHAVNRRVDEAIARALEHEVGSAAWTLQELREGADRGVIGG